MARRAITVVDGVTSEPSGERMVILSADGSAMTTLNPVGAQTWSALESGATTLDELVAALHAHYPTTAAAVLANDVLAFVGELSDLGLVVHDQP